MRNINFKSAEEMFDLLANKEIDLYNPELELYLFVYNENGAICTYGIDTATAKTLSAQSKETGDYWGAFLGIGGHIYDAPANMSLCEEIYSNGTYIPTEEYI